jgi:phospholipase/lecithinase/hemolysin
MTTRRRWHISALAAAALIVAGCGGGDTNSPLASRVVAFGDSLSDLGTYAPATSINGPGTGAPFFGGRWTTNVHTGYTAANNTNTAVIWVEWIAARLGVAMTQAEIGFATTRIQCPAAARGLPVNSCSGYAQGGSRVTDPNGIGRTSGALTIPLAEQIAMHNARSTGVGTAAALPGFRDGFSSDDIVFVYGGNNDVFVQFGAVGQGVPAATAIANVVTAATELVALVKDEILAKGGKRVAVMTLPDSSATPFGASLGPAGDPQAEGSRALLRELSAQFNTALLAGLDGSGARIIDARALAAAVQASPASFGLTNIATPACAATSFNATASSLLCNAAPASAFTAAGVPNLNGLAPGASASTYLFADSVHPTTAGHKIFADQVWLKLKDFGWVPDNL